MVAGGMRPRSCRRRSPAPLSCPHRHRDPSPTAPSGRAPAGVDELEGLGDPFIVSTRRDADSDRLRPPLCGLGRQARRVQGPRSWSTPGRWRGHPMGGACSWPRRTASSCSRTSPIPWDRWSTRVQPASRQGMPEEGRRTDDMPAPVVRSVVDGQHLAFVQQPNHHPGSYGVATMDLTTGRVTVLKTTLSRNSKPVEGVRWSPDGSRLVYSHPRPGRPRPGRVAAVRPPDHRCRWPEPPQARSPGPLRERPGLVARRPNHRLRVRHLAHGNDARERHLHHRRRRQPRCAACRPTAIVTSLTWLGNGRILYSSGDRFWVMTADGDDATPLSVLDGLDQPHGHWLPGPG